MLKLCKHSALALASLILLLSGACAGQAATGTPVIVGTSVQPSPIVVTKAIINPDNTATPIPGTDTPMPTVAQTAVPSTAGPTITSSGPTLASSENNAVAFGKAVPTQVGSLKRVSGNTAISPYGTGFIYRTEEGAEYEVALWITASAQEALERYALETGSLTNKQPLKLGDEAIITSSGYILAEVRYRNMVLIIKRPLATSTVKYRPLTDDEVINFVTTIFKSIPAS